MIKSLTVTEHQDTALPCWLSWQAPVIQEIKWMTFYAAVTSINNNFGRIVEVLAEVGASNLFAGSLWRSFSDAIMCDSKFTLKIQADCTFLHNLDDEYLVTHQQLEDLRGNEFAFHLRINLNGRMHHPADGTLANLAFILTPRGFHWFQKQLADIRQVKPLEHPLETLRLARVQLNKQIEEMRHELSQTCSHFGLNTGTLAADFDHYLDGSGPERARDLLKFWNVEADSESRLFDFAKIAWQLLQIPASESTAERAFSVLEALFPRCRAVSNAKLLEAELRIRLEQIYDKIMERTHHNEKKRE